MKITIKKQADGGFTVGIDRPPLPEGRFRALCALAAAGVYAGMVIGVAALCGLLGVLLVAVITVLCLMIVAL